MDEGQLKTPDTLAIAALVALWAETLVSMPGLPDIVPTSFGHDGMPQAYSSKFELLLLPAIGIAIWFIVGLTIRGGSVGINVPFTIPEDRMPLIQPLSQRVIRILRVELLAGFVALQWAIIESAKAGQLVPGFGTVITVFVAATIALVGWFVYRVWTIANSG